MFGAIASTLGRVFGTDKAAASLVDNVSKGLDKLVYTSEEKADAQAADVSEARKMIIDWMAATSGQNLARRLIALIVTGVWVLQYLTAMALSVVAVWADKPEKFTASAKIMGDYANQMNGAMMLILAFYFAAPHMGQIVSGAMAKFSKKANG